MITSQGRRLSRRGFPLATAGVFFALLVLNGGSTSASGAEAANLSYRAEVQKVHEHLMALENAWHRLLVRKPGPGNGEWMELSLEKAVMGNDLHLELVHSDASGSQAQAFVPRLCRAVHPVRIGAFSSTGEVRIEGQVTLDLEGDSLARDLMAGLAHVPAKLVIKVKSDQGRVTGQFTLEPMPQPSANAKEPPKPSPLAAAKGLVTGSSGPLQEPRPAKPEHWAPNEKDRPEDLFILATQLEHSADAWYQRIRLLDLVRRYQAPLDEASRHVMVPVMDRPPLAQKPGKSGGPSSPDTGIPDVNLDDLGGLEGLGVAGSKPKSKDLPDSELKKGAATLADISRRTAALMRLVTAYENATRDPVYVQDSIDNPDPQFGPWYGEETLPEGKDRISRLPADAGGNGPQIWAAVPGWRVIGPFPLTRFEWVTPHLPDLVWSGNENCRLPPVTMEHYKGKDGLSWTPTPKMPALDFGYVSLPKWFSFNPYYMGLPPVLGYREYQNLGHGGLPNSTAYLLCDIESPNDVELWAGIGVNQRGRLWLDDQLVWQGPSRVDPLYMESTGLLRLPFHKGLNRLVLRLDVDYSSPYCWLRVCLRGKPRTAAEVKAAAESVQTARRALQPEKTVGWRGNGTGHYPDANPPMAWNQKKKQNIRWHVPHPYFGNATPVPAPGSNRLFITQDPHWLICLDQETGQELWRRAVTLLDLLPEQDRKQGWALNDAWWKARQERDSVPAAEVTGMKYKVPKWLQYQDYWAEGTGIWRKGSAPEKNEREGATPELVALLDKRDELEQAPDPASVQEELTQVLRQIEKLQARNSGNDPDSPQAKEARVEKAEQEYVKFLGRFCHVSGMGGGYWSDYCGWMYPTPVTDGKHVWLKTGTDVAACYDLDGNEKWKVQVWGAGGGDHMLSSPVLCQGTLILPLNDNDNSMKGKPAKGGIKLLALNAATGATVWETRGLTDNAWNNSTPALMTLTDGKEILNVIVTSCGTVVRVDDGKVLVRNPGVQSGFASPLVQDDIVVAGQAALTAVQFIMQSRDSVGFRRLWAVRGGSHGLIDNGGAVIVDGRILHTVSIGGSGKRGGESVRALGLVAQNGANEGWRALEGYDLQTGQYAFALPILRKGGNQWTPASVSRKHVYHVVGDRIFQSLSPKAPMDMVVTTRDPVPLRLANNAIDRTYGAGSIEGDRIFIRGYYGVTCVGYTGDEGRRYEARIVARNLLDDIYPDRPTGKDPREVPMSAATAIKTFAGSDPRNVPNVPANCRLLSGQAPHRWWMLGPLPAGTEKAALVALGGPAAAIQGDGSITLDGKAYAWGPLTQSFLKVPGFKEWELDPINFCDIHRVRRVLDLGQATGGQAPSVVYLMTEWQSDAPQVMRFDQTLPGVRSWIGGQEIAHGDRLQFGKGVCQLLMEIPVTAIPEDGLQVSPRFWTSADPAAEEKEWQAAVLQRRPYLESVVKLAPGTPEAESAARVLRDSPKP